MPARNHSQWTATPPVEFVDSRIYSDPDIFEEELEKIFKKTWIPVCHESELSEPYDFRTSSIAREPIIVTRDADGQVRAFLNVCPHRGMMIERRPSGSFLEGSASGTPKHMTCMFHAWQFDMKGNCVDITRREEGYQDRLQTEQVGLRRLRCEVAYGGFVWVNLEDKPKHSLKEFIGDAFDCLFESDEAEPMEGFHYHKAVIGCN